MEDKRRKSHEAFLNLFYPPRANQSQRQQEEEQAVLNPTLIGAVPYGVSDNSQGEEEVEEEGRNSSSESASECTVRNLTRSQRKRIRRKKLKQAATSRRRIIGPMLPSTEEILELPFTLTPPLSLSETIIDDAIDDANAVVGAGNRHYRGPPRNMESNKLKQRRMAKKLRRSTNNCSVKELEIPPPDMSPAQQLPEFPG